MKLRRFIDSDTSAAVFCLIALIACGLISAQHVSTQNPTVDNPITGCTSTVNERAAVLASTAIQHWPRKHRVPDKQLVFAALFTDEEGDPMCNKEAILSAIDIAVNRVRSKGDLLEGFNITVEYRNTRSSSKWGPLEAFDLYVKRKPGSSSIKPRCSN